MATRGEKWPREPPSEILHSLIFAHIDSETGTKLFSLITNAANAVRYKFCTFQLILTNRQVPALRTFVPFKFSPLVSLSFDR